MLRKNLGKATQLLYLARSTMAMNMTDEKAVDYIQKNGIVTSVSTYKRMKRYIRKDPNEQFKNLVQWQYASISMNLMDTIGYIINDLKAEYINDSASLNDKLRIAEQLGRQITLLQNGLAIERTQYEVSSDSNVESKETFEPNQERVFN